MWGKVAVGILSRVMEGEDVLIYPEGQLGWIHAMLDNDQDR